MTLENQILDAIIQDHKERAVLGVSPFGDIFFAENDGYGNQLYLVCQILTRQGVPSNPNAKGKFNFEIKALTQEKKTASHLVKPGLSTPLKMLRARALTEVYDEINVRFGLKEVLTKRLGKLSRDEVFGHCYRDAANSTNDFARVLKKEDYLTEVLAYAKEYPRTYYSDIYELKVANEFGPLVQKVYLGYGFEVPDAIFNYINLKSLVIYKQSVKDVSPEKLARLKNLNELAFNNAIGWSQAILDVVHQLPYLVELSLSNSGAFAGGNSFTQIPKKLDTLQSLRYFSFAGNELQDWSEIVKLKNLRTLDVSNCGLTSISEQISKLEFLEELNLGNNKIQYLPDGILQLKNLKVLRLNGNQLVEIPQWIGQLQSLQLLDLTQAELTTLPAEIVSLQGLQELHLKKNPFKSLPKEFIQLPKKIVKIEMRNEALYDAKAKTKLDTYPKGNVKFEGDFNFKLMVINQLMYVDKVLLPKFDVWGFVKTHKKRKIDIEEEGYAIIPEVISYFQGLEIPMDLLIDIKELKSDGGDEIYRQIIPFWDGEDDQFDVKSIEDVKYLPNLKATNSMNFPKELIKELRAKKIKVANY